MTVIVAPVVLGAGKRLFDGFTQSLDLEQLGVRQSRYATFIDYRVKRPALFAQSLMAKSLIALVSRLPWWPRRGC